MKSPRHIALEVLIGVETKKHHPDDLLSRAFKKNPTLTDRDRAFITELVYGTLRWQGKIDWILARFSRIKTQKMEWAILCIIRMGIYQILYMTKTPSRAAVDESVILANKLKTRESAGFVNGLLRTIVREYSAKGSLEIGGDTPQEVLAIEEAFPVWVVERLWGLWGEIETAAFCRASNQIAPLTLRTNTLRTDRTTLINRLRQEGLSVSPTAYSPEGILLTERFPASRLPLLESGYFQIQDEAAQLITYLVDPKPGEMVLDVCAAPGAKSVHMAQLMNNRGKIFALDVDGDRLRLLRTFCSRAGITNVTILKRDAAQPLPFPEEIRFDAILVDAPCTGWGTIRRNPDIKCRTRPEDLTRMAAVQEKILDNAAGQLKEGGRLVYSTCTVFPEENENVVDRFVREHAGFSLADAKSPILSRELFDGKGLFRTLPHRHGTDGFFASIIRMGSVRPSKSAT